MSKRRKWSDEETQYLIENYQDTNNKQIADYLSMRVDQVKSKAHRLKLQKRSVGSKEIDEFILKNHDSMSIADLVKETGLNRNQVNRAKKRLGVSKELITRPWLEEEDEFIIKNHQSMSYWQISEALGRRRMSVVRRSVYLNLDPKNKVMSKEFRLWTPEEEKYLSDNYLKISTGEIAENIDRTDEAIRARASLLGLCADQDE